MTFADDCKRVAATDVRDWLTGYKWSYIWGQKGGGVAVAKSEQEDAIILDEQVIQLTWVPGIQGSKRLFFLCPACEQRCTKLYIPPNHTELRCRTCWKLQYRSQHEPKKVRMWKKREKLLAILNDFSIRPHIRRKAWVALDKVERKLFPALPTTKERLDWSYEWRGRSALDQAREMKRRGYVTDLEFQLFEAKLRVEAEENGEEVA